ncbi:MAG: AI-2E family transporter [Treponema sp.]|nr:AI-2E family transporter [Treponema sp.]
MRTISKPFNPGRPIFFLMVFICCIIAGAVLRLTAVVLLPFTIAVLLAFVMYPMVKKLDKIRCPRTVSILLVVFIIVTGLYVFGMILFTSGRMIAEQFPRYEHRFIEIYTYIARVFELPFDEDLTFFENLWAQLGIRTFVRDFTLTFSNVLLQFIISAVLVILFVVFILMEASFIREKLDTAFENRSDRINKMGHDLMSQVTRYLAAKFVISLANGVIFAVSFHLVGLEFAVVWGVIQFLLNFIPNLGSITAGVVISLFALIQFWPDPIPIIMVLAIILAVNLILCNIFDPKIVGEHVGISPLIILLSLAIWGWIWGFAGMVLAVPMTVIIKIVCENIPIMEPVSILLGTRKSTRAKRAERERLETEKQEAEKPESGEKNAGATDV